MMEKLTVLYSKNRENSSNKNKKKSLILQAVCSDLPSNKLKK